MRFEISEILKQDAVMNLVFGNYAVPKNILGRHYVSNGQVITAFHPNAVSMKLIDDKGNYYEMDQVERQPIFALFLTSRKMFDYKIEMRFLNGNTFVTEDPYNFEPLITKREEQMFMEGNWYDSYKRLGAHPVEIDGVKGTYFAVWAPNAKRVSVMGDFNFWNGLQYPMHRMERSGIFELFIPGVGTGSIYKFEVKTQNGSVFQKIDPYGFETQKDCWDASVVRDLDEFAWEDTSWISNRKLRNYTQEPISICDVSKGKYDFDRMQKALSPGVYTHALLSQTAGTDDDSGANLLQYGMYSPFYCHGSCDEFRNLINTAHKMDTGVLMEICLENYRLGMVGLEKFDGTCLYGFKDDRIGKDLEKQLYRFNIESPQIVNYLLSDLLFWVKEYHVDGFVISHVLNDDVLDASIAFMKKVVETVKDYDSSIIMIADDMRELKRDKYSNLKETIKFDFYWNYSIKSSVDYYFSLPYMERPKQHYRLSLPLRVAKVEESLLLLNHKDDIRKMNQLEFKSGDDKLAAVEQRKMTCGFLLGMPGKKVWAYEEDMEHPMLTKYRIDLLRLFNECSALAEYDPVLTPLEWINPMDAETGVVTFIRKTIFGEEDLLFVCNFSNKVRSHYKIGVPKYGRYHLISNSNSLIYGGSSKDQELILDAKQECYDLKPFSVSLDIPPFTTMIFQF